MPRLDNESITVRNCASIEEFRVCVALQREVWGWDDEDLIPARFFVVAHKIEGQVIGAFDPSGRMVGFCLGVPALKGSEVYIHSHMLAVLPEYRRAGLGRRLKLEQRRQALERGIRLVEWTFDPLEWRNAIFNLNRLGAIARRYVENQYGISSSPLHRGLPTDRLIAEWHLDSPRVVARLDGDAPTAASDQSAAEQRIALPLDVMEHSTESRPSAAEIQTNLRPQFQQFFAQGLSAIAFEVISNSGYYLLNYSERDR
jgi:predicted GNAT superfamily acetyltransferase